MKLDILWAHIDRFLLKPATTEFLCSTLADWGRLCKERCQKPCVRNTLALPCLKTSEKQSTLRKKHLQCSAKEPWDGSGKQQGGRKAAGFSSLAWVSLSVLPCCRQGPCRDHRERPAAIGAAVPRAVTARDAHGCTWRRGKTASSASRRDLPHLRSMAHAALKECFTPKPLHAGLWTPQPITRPSCGVQDMESGPDLRSRTAWAVGQEQSQAGIGVPFGIWPAQQQLSMYYVGLLLPRPQRGPNPSSPLLRCRGSSSKEGLLTSPQGESCSVRAEAAALLHPLLTRTDLAKQLGILLLMKALRVCC